MGFDNMSNGTMPISYTDIDSELNSENIMHTHGWLKENFIKDHEF